ncbi:ATP-grasp ribosomal peptide maturase [Carbonactinospora thermoautotrophica]|uniref:ATP-grasp ribosomal peptide maturase n=1 Tax=Carbonactinospora thermoautotrophica TaxID=1469144 RepID=UPI0022714B88|nr:ATP-grasp ribosomal peptide maturase [Carbonactinospora thermoautotrophica]MCX9191357.1 ATP-grasp ribosomal peptide maturase [Carbonactinospora thermoautotrophica]
MGDERPVLVVTRLDDPTADNVIAELNRRAVPVVRLDAAQFPTELSLAALVGGGAGLRGRLRTASRTADLAGVRSLYYRRPSAFAFPRMTEQDRAFAGAQARYGLGGVLASLPGCLYVNHPHRIADAEFKPMQLATAVEVGFTVPATLITNDPDTARDFARQVGPVVYKPLRAVPYTEDGATKAVWVEEVDPAEFDDSIRLTAHLFQAKIDKIADARVTVVGDRVFAVRIDGNALDWRYDYDALAYQVVEPPARLVTALHDYLARFGLVFGAFDFALTADGDWVFLECNPNGQWGWLEPATGLPLTAAVADLLQKGRTHA